MSSVTPVSLIRTVTSTIRRRALLDARDRIIVALSGGPDSVALLSALLEIAQPHSWTVVGVVHVNHGLRGAESDGDEAFCRALASRIGLPISVTRVDLGERRPGKRLSVEAAARELRYQCFESAAKELSATVVATGHTADDQAETVLLRLLRGTGGRGLSAIRPRRGLYARPLIDTRRADVEAYLAAGGHEFRTDHSNRDPAIPRNRLRQTLMPLLMSQWPGAVRALARFAELAADDETFLMRTAAEVAPALTLEGDRGVQLDIRGLVELPPALGRRVVRQAIEKCGGVPTFEDVEAVRRLAAGSRASARLDLRRVRVSRRGVVLSLRAARRERVTEAFEYELAIPGGVHVSETRTTIRASLSGEGNVHRFARRNTTVALLQADSVQGPFRVRNRRPGDRFRPLGSPGQRKLQDVLVDRKVPRDDRDRVHLVVDATGRIVWVAGVEIAHDCRVTAPERGMVVLEIKDTE